MEVWKPSSKPITYEEWLERGSAMDRLVIHFWAKWNNVDKQADEALQQALQASSKSIEARCFDTDECPDTFDWLRSDLKLVTLPTVIGFSKGTVLGRVIALQGAQAYQEAFADWFA
ncbi:MAG: thioredoxin family protein [Planctomycetota bacterium]